MFDPINDIKLTTIYEFATEGADVKQLLCLLMSSFFPVCITYSPVVLCLAAALFIKSYLKNKCRTLKIQWIIVQLITLFYFYSVISFTDSFCFYIIFFHYKVKRQHYNLKCKAGKQQKNRNVDILYNINVTILQKILLTLNKKEKKCKNIYPFFFSIFSQPPYCLLFLLLQLSLLFVQH